MALFILEPNSIRQQYDIRRLFLVPLRRRSPVDLLVWVNNRIPKYPRIWYVQGIGVASPCYAVSIRTTALWSFSPKTTYYTPKVST